MGWLAGAATGDFGQSLISGESASEAISDRLLNTLFLAAYAAVIAVPFSIGLGVIVALLRNSLFDRVANVLTLTSISSPEFFLGYILILYLAVKTGLFPAIASLSSDMSFGELLERTFLPALTLVLVVTAHMMRMTRAAIINLLASPYIEMARLKGAPPWKVIVRHALPNAWAPIINVVALNPSLPHNRRGAGRGRVRLSRDRTVARGFGGQARFPDCAGLLPDFCGDVHTS